MAVALDRLAGEAVAGVTPAPVPAAVPVPAFGARRRGWNFHVRHRQGFARAPRTRPAGIPGTDDGGHPAPRPRRLRLLLSTARVALGHRRLSIIDLAARPPAHVQRGRQLSGSSTTARSSTTPTLRPELERAGHRYARAATPRPSCTPTRSTGRSCVTRFRGMFAFAIWDARHADAVLRARPAGHQALLLLLGRPAVRLRLRDQGAARASRASRRALDESVLPEYLGVRLRERRADAVRAASAS